MKSCVASTSPGGWSIAAARGTPTVAQTQPYAGRHSLGTKDKQEALQLLPELDRVRAEDLGLAPRSAESNNRGRPLPLADGRKLYEQHIARPRVTGGVRQSTKRSYRSVFDKFIPFATRRGVTVWNGVTASLLNRYAEHLEGKGYAHKTLVNELTTLKQAVKWMIQAGHLKGTKPIELKLRKAESQPAYCYPGLFITASDWALLCVLFAKGASHGRSGHKTPFPPSRQAARGWQSLSLPKGQLESQVAGEKARTCSLTRR